MPPRPSAGGIVVGPDGRIALIEQHGNSWSFPKGGIEAGETEIGAARREIEEETGLTDITLVDVLGSYERYSISKDGKGESVEWGSRKRTLFLFTTEQDFPAGHHDPAGEITATRWATPEEVLTLLTHPKDRVFFESVIDKVRSAIQ